MMKQFVYVLLTVIISAHSYAQNADSTDTRQSAEQLLVRQLQQQHIDSMIRQQISAEMLDAAGNTKDLRRLQDQLDKIATEDSVRSARQKQEIATLKQNAHGYPVVLHTDTLFYIYTRIGSFSAKERANAVAARLLDLYKDPYFSADSLDVVKNDFSYDIVNHREEIIMSVTALDALWMEKANEELANDYLLLIRKTITDERHDRSLFNQIKRISLTLLVVAIVGFFIFLINKIFKRLFVLVNKKGKDYFHGFSVRNVTILQPSHQKRLVLRGILLVRLLIILLVIYLSLPLMFSIFPETKNWTNTLIGWILRPAGLAVWGVIHYLPNLFTIIVIWIIFHYAIRAVRYFADEIGKGAIHVNGFHHDWAKPTFNIVRFLLYAFMLILIFPYLPGSGSPAFQGVSVFLGILLSLGSSSAITNMVAGMVITYMRPFKIGDRVKIGDITGDVLEKTLLVTRIKTVKNEDVTVPNSNILSNSTINFSTNTRPEDSGLIVHTSVTIGYDVPWQKMHEVLIEAALKTDMILQEPKPFVLQTSLEDFYVAYQINAYTKEANKQAVIYSLLHQNIQDCCKAAGIEIMSPHYRAVRDGSDVTIPPDAGNS